MINKYPNTFFLLNEKRKITMNSNISISASKEREKDSKKSETVFISFYKLHIGFSSLGKELCHLQAKNPMVTRLNVRSTIVIDKH